MKVISAARVATAASAVLVVGVLVCDAVPGYSQGGDDHAVATALVQELGQDTAHAAVTGPTLAHASEALERAVRFRSAGDETHAKAADGLAREWAETARDLVRSADAEASANEVKHKAVDAEARVERARALVEESIARVGRLTAELDAAGHGAGKDHHAVEVHDASKGGAGAGAGRGGRPQQDTKDKDRDKDRGGAPPSTGDRP